MNDDDIFDLILQYNLNKVSDLMSASTSAIGRILCARTNSGNTPLMAALEAYKAALDTDREDVARQIALLILKATQKWAPEVLTMGNNKKNTPMGMALMIGDLEFFSILCQAPSNLTAPCFGEYLPLDLSLSLGFDHASAHLIMAGAPLTLDLFSKQTELNIAQQGRPLSLILYQACWRAPLSAQLIAALILDNVEMVAKLAPNPAARWGIGSLVWSNVFCLLLQQRDRACSLLVPYLHYTTAVDHLIAFAVEYGAVETFTALMEHFNWNYDVGIEEVLFMAARAIQNNRPSWALRLVKCMAEMMKTERVELQEQLPDNTVLSPLNIEILGVPHEAITLIINHDGDTITCSEDIGVLERNPNIPECMATIAPAILTHASDEFTLALAQIIEPEDTNTLPSAWFEQAIVTNNQKHLDRLLLLPWTTAKLTRIIPCALASKNHRALMKLLLAGACPAFDQTGVVLNEIRVQPPEVLKNVKLIKLIEVVISQENPGSFEECAALTLMCFNFPTVYATAGGSMSIYDVTMAANVPKIAKRLAMFGVSPITYFTAFLASPSPEAETCIQNILSGLLDCAQRIGTYGYHGAWLLAQSFQWQGGNRGLIALLGDLETCNVLSPSTQTLAREVAEVLIKVEVSTAEGTIEPLSVMIFEQHEGAAVKAEKTGQASKLPVFLSTDLARAITTYLIRLRRIAADDQARARLPRFQYLLTSILSLLSLAQQDPEAAQIILDDMNRQLN